MKLLVLPSRKHAWKFQVSPTITVAGLSLGVGIAVVSTKRLNEPGAQLGTHSAGVGHDRAAVVSPDVAPVAIGHHESRSQDVPETCATLP